jgi:glycosyltransferase involved in cell wall biosynthesis
MDRGTPGHVHLMNTAARADTAAWTTGRIPRVLQIGKYYPPYMGGMETHLQVLCEALRGAVEIDVVVAAGSAGSSHERVCGIHVDRLSTWFTMASAPVCPAMLRRIRRSAADLFHIHLPNPMAVVAWLASGRRDPLVVTYHSDTVRQVFLGAVFDPIQHSMLGRAAAIIATSPNYAATSPVLARHRDRCHVIPYGIPLEQFQTCTPGAVDQLRREYGDRLVLAVGRLVYYKGFENLIAAMRDVNGRLLIAGDGPLRHKLQGLAARSGTAGKVVFLGEIPNSEITPFYHAASLFALPSVARSEAFGIVQIEAMTAGTPVVNTRLDSGVPFVSLDQMTGLTVPPGDVAALGAAINRLLDDAGLRRRLGDAARARATSEFSVEIMRSRILALYAQVLAARPSAS